MRVGFMVAAVVVAGCSFDVIGTNVGDPAGGSPATPSPTQSVPDGPDSGIAATPPPTAGPDMATQRVGTACTSNTQCDPGLICGKTFGVGAGKIDIPGGYCTLDCTTTACPANSFCATFTFGKFACRRVRPIPAAAVTSAATTAVRRAARPTRCATPPRAAERPSRQRRVVGLALFAVGLVLFACRLVVVACSAACSARFS